MQFKSELAELRSQSLHQIFECLRCELLAHGFNHRAKLSFLNLDRLPSVLLLEQLPLSSNLVANLHIYLSDPFIVTRSILLSSELGDFVSKLIRLLATIIFLLAMLLAISGALDLFIALAAASCRARGQLLL